MHDKVTFKYSIKLALIATALLVAVALSSCADDKKIEGVTYEPYGLANENTHKNDSVSYELSPGSVICAIIFCETIIAPVYIIGWDLFEPTSTSKVDPKSKGVRQ